MEANRKEIPAQAMAVIAQQERRINEATGMLRMEQGRGQELLVAIGSALGIEDMKSWQRTEDGKAFEPKIAGKSAGA